MTDFTKWLSKGSIGSLLAVIWSIGCIIIMFNAAKGYFHASETIITMVLQGALGIAMLILGAYFSKEMKKGTDKTE